jgi:TRAP-type C4-dicarboxylate transport system permease small subunit
MAAGAKGPDRRDPVGRHFETNQARDIAMNHRLQRWIDRFRTFAEVVSGLMFAGIFVVFIIGIVMRYVFDAPLLWGDEVAMMLLLWVTFLTDAFVVRGSDHVAFDVVWDVASPPARRIMGILGRAVFALIFLAALPTIVDYVLFLWREHTDVLEIRFDVLFFCFVIYIAMVVVRLVAQLVEFSGAAWREHVGHSDVGDASTQVIG